MAFGYKNFDIYLSTKIQNDAVRFIYNIKGKRKWESVTPYLKKLHFLPVRYRIRYKIAMMVFKCINNFAPDYLSELIKLREPRKHCVRLDNDYFMLDHVMNSNVKSSLLG